MSTTDANSHLVRNKHAFYGVTAEIISVLEDASLTRRVITEAAWHQIYQALDTTIPAEERTLSAETAISAIIRTRQISGWIPRYSNLATHEFANEFYPGYRDHSIHSLQVFLLGLYLYELVTPLRSSLDSHLGAATVGKSVSDLFLEWWALAALWHDTGYPFEATAVATSPVQMRDQLASIAATLNKDIFRTGIDNISSNLTKDDLRTLYQCGRFYPLEFDSPDLIIRDEFVEGVLDKLWHRLKFLSNQENPTRELDRLCVQASKNRGAFHDHGFFSAGLLGIAARESKSFLFNLADAMSSKSPPQLSGNIDAAAVWAAWEEVELHWPLIGAAMEAIAYHNFSTDYIDPERLSTLAGTRERPAPSLRDEPHLFFLGLTDTLQDWDRHHFVPNSVEGRFRPAVRAKDMLVQGDAKAVRVAIQSKPDAQLAVRGLLKGWLDSYSVNSIITGDATYSRPDKILAGSTTTLIRRNISQEKKRSLKSDIDTAVERAQKVLIRGADTAIIEASAIINECLVRIEEANTVLAASDREELADHLQNSGMAEVEQAAFMRIKTGTALQMGVVKESIGNGGFGTVFRVDDNAHGGLRTYAFKLFHANDLRIQEKRRLFRRGYDAMERLAAHPNIVSVYRFSFVPMGFFMDFVPGTNLEHALSSKWTLQDRMDVIKTVAETLAYAHSQGVLHRDVKPSNVLINNIHGNPVLTDFDLAWIDGRTQNTKSQYATMHFGAPEQFEKRSLQWLTLPTVDIYGFAALAFFTLTGQEPPVFANWKEENWERLSESVGQSAVAAFVREIEHLIKDCTQYDPKDRPQEMEVVVARLSKAMLLLESEAELQEDDWLLEVMHASGGGTASDPLAGFVSRAGGVRWRIERITRQHQKVTGLDAVCTLNRDPRFEGVNFRGFSKGSVKQVDTRLQQFKSSPNQTTSVVRHGQLVGAGTTMTLSFTGLEPSKACARSVGALLASVSRIVE